MGCGATPSGPQASAPGETSKLSKEDLVISNKATFESKYELVSNLGHGMICSYNIYI